MHRGASGKAVAFSMWQKIMYVKVVEAKVVWKMEPVHGSNVLRILFYFKASLFQLL